MNTERKQGTVLNLSVQDSGHENDSECESWPKGTASQLNELTAILRNLGLLSNKPQVDSSAEFDDRNLANVARFIWSMRRLRAGIIGPDLCGEPAWDMLLDLFCRQVANQLVYVKGACLSADVPTTTALRWIDALSDRGWIERAADLSDKRRQTIFLTPNGMAKVRQCLQVMAQHMATFDMTDPHSQAIFAES